MKFTKTLLSSALLLAVSATAAQAADVTVYGVIDEGIMMTKSSDTKTQVTMESGITKSSRIGFDGKEDLGNGYTVFFNLENGFKADTGALNTDGSLFDRNAVVGLKGAFGSVNMGRTGALGSGNGGGIFGGTVSPFGITWKEAAMTKIYVGNIAARVSNQVRYETPSFGGFKGYVQYSLGTDDDSTRDSEHDRYLAAGATYRNGPVAVTFVVDNLFKKDTSTSAGLDDVRTIGIGGNYDFGGVKVYAGYQYGTNVVTPRQGNASVITAAKAATSSTVGADEGYDTHAVSLGTNIDLWGGELKAVAGYAQAERDYLDSEAKVYQLGLGYKYNLSKRTYVYGAFATTRGKSETSTKSDEVDTRTAFLAMCHSF